MKQPQRLAWFRDARFGMFIHWGAYSASSLGELSYWGGTSLDEYKAQSVRRFTARRYDPAGWAALARQAGCRYMVLTTRHYDGYCLFNTDTTDFNAARMGPRRDLVEPFVRACRAAGIKVGLYYNLRSFWQRGGLDSGHGWTPHADYTRRDHLAYYDLVRRQLRELFTRYGRIDLLFFDQALPDDPQGKAARPITAMIRRLQPHVLINNRDNNPNDYDTPEQVIVSSTAGRLWETCMTIGCWWGYHRTDAPIRNPVELCHNLQQIARNEGNFCLNVGPLANGRIPAYQARTFQTIGRWLAVNGEAIYGSRRGPDVFCTCGSGTVVGNRLYLHAFRYEAPECVFRGLLCRVLRITCLATGKPVAFEQKGDVVRMFDLPRQPPDPVATVYRIEVRGTLRSDFP